MTALNESTPNMNPEQGDSMDRPAPNDTHELKSASPAPPAAPRLSSPSTPAEDGLLHAMVGVSLKLRLLNVQLESTAGLSGRELDLVTLLTTLGPTSVKNLVVDLGLPRSTMTAIVDRLEERSLVTRSRNPQDLRSVVLEATPAASEVLARYREGVSALVRHTQKVLDGREQAEFARMIQKLSTAR